MAEFESIRDAMAEVRENDYNKWQAKIQQENADKQSE